MSQNILLTMPINQKSRISRFLIYALIGCILAAALVGLTFTGASFAIMLSLATAALLHSLIGICLELYNNHQKPNLTLFEKIKLGVALTCICTAGLGLMIVFPHIGIPIAGVMTISLLALGASFLPVVQHFFKHVFHDTIDNLEPQDATDQHQNNIKSLQRSITTLEKRRTDTKPLREPLFNHKPNQPELNQDGCEEDSSRERP